jgi:outer membrane cobalamin receptor
MTREEILRLGAWQVADAAATIPGAFIKNYGGIGGLKTISVRGTTSQQTIVLLDGVRLTSSANGTVDLSTLPLIFFDEFEVLRGGNSAVVGGGAVAGVVNLRSSVSPLDSTKRPISATAATTIGSFGEILTSGAVGFSALGARWNVGGEYLHSTGDYPFQSLQFGKKTTIKRTNADFQNIGIVTSAGYEHGEWIFNSRLFLRTTKRGSPGAVLQGSIEQISARLDENEAIMIHTLTSKPSNNSTLTFASSARYGELYFKDKDALFRGAEGANDLFITRETMVSATIDWLTSLFHARVSSELTYSDLRGNSFQPQVGSFVQRTALSLAANADKDIVLDSSFTLAVQTQSRIDINSRNTDAFSPLVGCMLRNADIPIRLRTSWSYNFRLPNFNEMYYLNFGTASLRPERAQLWNLGLVWDITSNLQMEVESFSISTNDQIIAVPKSPISWSAQNIGKVYSRGIELSAGGEFISHLLTGRLAYTRQSTTDETAYSLTIGKQIPYIPQEIISGNIVSTIKQTTLGFSANYSSFRYTLADNAIERIIPAFIQVNVFGEQKIYFGNINLILRVDCNNLFNEHYAVILNYPMPGRAFRLGIRGELAK